MTRQCREVIEAADFKSDLPTVREVEALLLWHSPSQLVKLFWSKDPRGEHDLEWFRPFFENGYVKSTPVTDMPPDALDEEFWQAYDWWSERAEFTTFDLEAIWTMSREPARAAAAYDRARVKSPQYVLKVFTSAESPCPPKRTEIDFEVGHGDLEVRQI